MTTDKKARAAASDSDQTASPASPAPKFTFTRRFPRFVIDVRLQVKMFQDGEFRTCWGRSTEMGQDGIGATLTGRLEMVRSSPWKSLYPLRPIPSKSAPSFVTSRVSATASNSSPSMTPNATPSTASATTSLPSPKNRQIADAEKCLEILEIMGRRMPSSEPARAKPSGPRE
jgi:hypothetical protein